MGLSGIQFSSKTKSRVIYCPCRVLAQRPKPEEASLESLHIVFILVLVYRKNLDQSVHKVVPGVVENACKWVLGGVIKFYAK